MLLAPPFYFLGENIQYKDRDQDLLYGGILRIHWKRGVAAAPGNQAEEMGSYSGAGNMAPPGQIQGT